MNWTQSLSYTRLIGPGNNSVFYLLSGTLNTDSLLFFVLFEHLCLYFKYHVMRSKGCRAPLSCIYICVYTLLSQISEISSIINGCPSQTWAFWVVNRKHRLSLPLGLVLNWQQPAWDEGTQSRMLRLQPVVSVHTLKQARNATFMHI